MSGFTRQVSAGVFAGSGDDLNPASVPGMALWLDTGDQASMRGAAGAAITSGAAVALLGDDSGNSAVNCLVSNTAIAAGSTAPTVSITGNFTASFDLAPTTWLPAASYTLFSKLSGNSGLEILLLITTGVVRVRIGDGAAITNFDSTAATGVAANTRGTLGITYVDNSTLNFTLNGSALGTQVSVNKVLANGAANATVGTNLIGELYSAIVTGKYNFNPVGAVKLAASFVAPTTGETWTINTTGDLGARICGERDLVQLTVANQPVWTSGAGMLFDGTNDYLKAAPFSLSQPTTVYAALQQVTWTDSDTPFDGNTVSSMQMFQHSTTPTFALWAGALAGANGGWPVATNAVITAVFSGASSASRVNRASAVTGNASTAAAGGFTLGAAGGFTDPANIRSLETIIYSVAHDTATQNRIIGYLGRKWGIAV